MSVRVEMEQRAIPTPALDAEAIIRSFIPAGLLKKGQMLIGLLPVYAIDTQ